MKRKDFLHLTGICSLGLLTIPHIALGAVQDRFTKAQLIGKGNPDITGNSYTQKMHKQTKVAFLEMKSAAAKDNISIEVVSAYRSFERQKEIFEGKYKRFTRQGLSATQALSKIIEYSTIPGTSRHHWGTDIDIIQANTGKRPSSVLQEKHFYGVGPFCEMKVWLTQNANSFGFYEVYTKDVQRKGFSHEPWHFSYRPVSRPMLRAYKKLDIKSILQQEKIKGSEHFSDSFIAKYIKEHILDINPELL
ncbi:MAG: D-alanyl-D-alanine carboxypeptidase [Flavobacteriaceae bacterium]|nr:MAG: D-alanyl-D-alanine carboxypeptidase [Flavobacteriaceae bacterium]